MRRFSLKTVDNLGKALELAENHTVMAWMPDGKIGIYHERQLIAVLADDHDVNTFVVGYTQGFMDGGKHAVELMEEMR